MKSPASVDGEGANVDQTECQGRLAGLKVMDKLHIYKTNLAGEVSNFVSIGFDPKQHRWAAWSRAFVVGRAQCFLRYGMLSGPIEVLCSNLTTPRLEKEPLACTLEG